jgi:hypothetical protein
MSSNPFSKIILLSLPMPALFKRASWFVSLSHVISPFQLQSDSIIPTTQHGAPQSMPVPKPHLDILHGAFEKPMFAAWRIFSGVPISGVLCCCLSHRGYPSCQWITHEQFSKVEVSCFLLNFNFLVKDDLGMGLNSQMALYYSTRLVLTEARRVSKILLISKSPSDSTTAPASDYFLLLRPTARRLLGR